ncbi:hypothetical protein HPB47_016334 [Ixodes persulcatus]|uniref:Uncharacterized protein n=1 Tax=Ixodes persulcatus TaxID=34615 RepID=A0AC60QR63_IXOPE|nr:hypothetical protein HPB47_016334 [Ixodes persulcatus]
MRGPLLAGAGPHAFLEEVDLPLNRSEVCEYGGTDYDALSYHNGEKFTIKKSTTDSRDGDRCSSRLSGGWWFKICNKANLNGRNLKHPSSTQALGITWYIKDNDESYKYTYDRVEMKIRDADFGFCTGSLKS